MLFQSNNCGGGCCAAVDMRVFSQQEVFRDIHHAVWYICTTAVVELAATLIRETAGSSKYWIIF